MGKNVAVFVDVANIFYAAKAAGVDIDYVTLLKAASAGRDLVRAYAYTGLDPENENQRNFHSFLARHGYRVVSKDIRKYGDGKVKANLDIELVVDMMRAAQNLDIAIVVSGDGDFAPAIRAVQDLGVRVEVISFRGNTSSDLIDVADAFTDITALAKVEKGSSRSGRRVAGADEDLSMTEVPDKQTEGMTGRVRGRGRGRGRTPEADVVRGGRGGQLTRPETEPAALTSSGAPLVVLPGERLSRAAAAGVDADEAEPAATYLNGQAEGDGEEGEGDSRRRRRRRGGRGRGRGRREEVATEAGPPRVEEEEFIESRPAARPTPFGSVWDTQLGVSSPTRPPSASGPEPEDEDFEEPEIPEYLIAEQRRNRGRGARQGAGRGPRGAYAAAMERERFGRGGGSGINRYPDVSGRERPREPGFHRPERGPRPERGRQERQERPERRPGGEPWSEVPPEVEAMLRAQLSSARPRSDEPRSEPPGAPSAQDVVTTTETAEAAPGAPAAASAEPTPRRRTSRRAAKAADEGAEATPASVDGVSDTTAAEPAPRRRATRRSAPEAPRTSETAVAEAEAAAPKRRTTRRTTTAAAAPTDGESGEAEKPRRRTTRRKPAESPAEAEAEAPAE